ncbi:hypothetical protein QYF36_016969 [Acer negundo]|nr:hypothetical protein QYF36_016969 [Acer negundo]
MTTIFLEVEEEEEEEEATQFLVNPSSIIINKDFQSFQNAIEVDDFLPQESISTDIVHNQSTSNACKKKNQNKKMKTSSHEDHKKWLHDHHHQINDPSTEIILQDQQRVPLRRSQKLSDKITALQKLVSPYGKTDTASVLQEANLYIKLLQQQIQAKLYSHKPSFRESF